MGAEINQQELQQYIADKTKLDPRGVQLVLKHEQQFISKLKPNKKGEIDIDFDDLVDYLCNQREIRLNELQIEQVLDAEMAYLMKHGHAVDSD